MRFPAEAHLFCNYFSDFDKFRGDYFSDCDKNTHNYFSDFDKFVFFVC